MRSKRIAFNAACVVVITAGILSVFKAARTLNDPLHGSFRSDDLEVVEKMPPLSDSIFRAISGRTVKALERKSYKQATSMAVSMGYWQGMTPEQITAMRNSIQNLKVTLATAALEGDTNAVAALEFLKSHSAEAR